MVTLLNRCFYYSGLYITKTAYKNNRRKNMQNKKKWIGWRGGQKLLQNSDSRAGIGMVSIYGDGVVMETCYGMGWGRRRCGGDGNEMLGMGTEYFNVSSSNSNVGGTFVFLIVYLVPATGSRSPSMDHLPAVRYDWHVWHVAWQATDDEADRCYQDGVEFARWVWRSVFLFLRN